MDAAVATGPKAGHTGRSAQAAADPTQAEQTRGHGGGQADAVGLPTTVALSCVPPLPSATAPADAIASGPQGQGRRPRKAGWDRGRWGLGTVSSVQLLLPDAMDDDGVLVPRALGGFVVDGDGAEMGVRGPPRPREERRTRETCGMHRCGGPLRRAGIPARVPVLSPAQTVALRAGTPPPCGDAAPMRGRGAVRRIMARTGRGTVSGSPRRGAFR
ncbi:hypothetical protein GCM10027028_12850 [Streptomyces sundarbansensis]